MSIGLKANSDGTSGTLHVNGNDIVSVLSSGNVGIGTTSPFAQLHLQSNANSSPGIIIDNNNTGTLAGTTMAFYAGANQADIGLTSENSVLFGGSSALRIRNTANGPVLFYTNNNERMRVAADGNVGIGMTAPIYKLDLDGGALGSTASNSVSLFRVRYGAGSNVGLLQTSAIRATNGSDWTSSRIRTQAQIDATPFGYIDYLPSGGQGQLAFGSGSTEYARFNNNGLLLLGTDTAVAGTWSHEIKTTIADRWPFGLNANNRGLIVRSSASTGYYAFFEHSGGTNGGYISFNGNTTSYFSVSDARIKDNIVDSPDAGDLIDTIKVRSWYFKNDNVHWRYGMIAQELLEVAPEAVHVPDDPDMMMGVDYAKLVPMLIKEVQSLRARVAELESK